MKYLFLIFLILYSFISTDQCEINENKIKGTLIIATITKEGIVLAADSRGVMFDEGVKFAYIDSIPKIFNLNQFTIAIAGYTAFGDKFLHQIIYDFSKTELSKSTFEGTFQKGNTNLIGIF